MIFRRSMWCVFITLLLAVLGLTEAVVGQTLDVVADTWVREDNPTSNRNGNGFMNARTDQDGDDNDVILLRFDTASLTGVAASSLNLTWYRTDGAVDKTLSLWGINDGSPDDIAWDETTVTYNDAPGLLPDGLFAFEEFMMGNSDDDIHDLDSANLTNLVADQDYGPQIEGELYTFSGSAIDDFLNADTNGLVTFLITRNTDTSGNQARFIQKEATEFQSGATVPGGSAGAFIAFVPEPRAGVIALVASLLAISIRRR